MQLIIVESPTKARTLSKFLGKEYVVEATMGHVRDLPKSTLGVDVEHDFTPSYIVSKEKKPQVKKLIDLVGKAESVILATDPDREGEAIAWHVASLIEEESQKTKGKKQKLKKSKKVVVEVEGTPSKVESFKRITFHEITESAIKDALTHPGVIDMELVNAQQARRILDRLVGYTLSPLLWKKLSRRWLSAGRVQSVTVRLIVEREREIEKFQKEPYFTIAGFFAGKEKANEGTSFQLISHNQEKYEVSIAQILFDGTYTVTKTSIVTEADADNITADIHGPYTVSAVEKKTMKRVPPAPYTTSTLQQDAGRKLYFSSKKTMQLAQKLYEEGLITYHRTDSVNLATKFIDEARDYISRTHGAKYVVSTARTYQTKSKVAQEAHEAIRPTDAARLAEALKEGTDLNHDHIRLYELIWKRTIACQMAEAVFDSTSIRITSENGYLFVAQGSVIVFDGYLKIAEREQGENLLPAFVVGQPVYLTNSVKEPHVTAPPPRYTEASLVKTLEEKDIGRPSTYAPIISTIMDRQYVTKEEKKLLPTDLGGSVTDFLVTYFPIIMDLPFTASLENDLDAIANGTKTWVPVVREMYEPFMEALKKAELTAEKVKLPVETLDEKCPLCQGALVVRTGRYGKFIACSNFPTCKYTRQLVETIDRICPKCGSQIIIKKTRRGKVFYGCSSYPKCDFAAWKLEDIK